MSSSIGSVLVTGGAGFIGSNFVHYLRRHYPDISLVVLDKLTYAGNLENLAALLDDAQLEFVQGDICDAEAVRQLARRTDAIVNFAAETHVDRSIESAGGFVQTDVYGAYVLLEAARDFHHQRFVQISTDEVYGEAGAEPCTEDAPLNPKSPYAASKAGGDRLAFAYWATYGVPVVITRCSNNYGPYQYPEKLIPLFITNALEEKRLPVYGTGKNTRDWIHVDDHCRALALALMGKGIEGEVVNIGSGEEYSALDIGREVCRVLQRSEDLIEHVADRPGHVMRHAVNVEKIERLLGWKAEMSFPEGLAGTVEWYRKNRGWWERIKSGEFREYYRRMYEERSPSGRMGK